MEGVGDLIGKKNIYLAKKRLVTKSVFKHMFAIAPPENSV